ncbi:hypothetical protein PsorP6_007366 [Peronosclerospora sorghi]|uniref:Uncharacterized protein n=1 Tax=Peronosclerospora sorghi TaxID=230839 RepID=A0ACC0WB70_9STRA|nr:hypothetical protein PsorP6_007366 [Peronosclerospora sorghi]
MQEHELPNFLWTPPSGKVSYGLRNGAYINNLMYHRRIDGIPAQHFFGAETDLHHRQPFEALVYIQVPNTSERSNVKAMSLFVTYSNTKWMVGVRVYFPSENTVKFLKRFICVNICTIDVDQSLISG